MSLSDSYHNEINKINDETSSWRHFLKDFKNELLSTAEVIELSPYQQRIYKYRLRDFLRETNRSVDLTWIIVWLNQLETEINFYNKNVLIIPNIQFVMRIRNMYDASKS